MLFPRRPPRAFCVLDPITLCLPGEPRHRRHDDGEKQASLSSYAAPLTHPLAVSCLPSQLCFLSTWAAPVLAREPKRRRAQQFIMGGARTGERTMGGARTGENCSEHCRLRAQQIQVRVMLAQCVSKTAGFSHNVTQANPSTK